MISDTGAVTATGRINSPALCITWDGTTMRREELDFRDGEQMELMKNKVFMTVQTEVVSQGYKVQSIGFDEEGNLDVEATYWPLASDDSSLCSLIFLMTVSLLSDDCQLPNLKPTKRNYQVAEYPPSNSKA